LTGILAGSAEGKLAEQVEPRFLGARAAGAEQRDVDAEIGERVAAAGEVGEQSAVERRGGRRDRVWRTAVFVALFVAAAAHAIKTAQRATLRIA